MKRLPILIISFLFAIIGSATAQTDLEKAIIDEINRARQYPQKYAEEVLVPMQKTYRGKTFEDSKGNQVACEEGTLALEEAIGYMVNAVPAKPLSYGKALQKAADALSAYQSKTGDMGHYRPDDINLDKMSGSACNGECCHYGSDVALDIVAQLIIDDGVPSRGHRFNIMFGEFSTAAASVNTHPMLGTCVVIDFACEITDVLSQTLPRTDEEKKAFSLQLLEEINLARTDPQRYVSEVLIPFKNRFSDDGRTYTDDQGKKWATSEGTTALDECITYMQNASPTTALSYSSTMQQTAEILAHHQSQTGKTGHIRPDNHLLSEYSGGARCGECCSYGNTSAKDIIATLLIDDGLKNRSHRQILLDQEIAEMGAVIVAHPKYDSCCVIDLCGKP